MDAKELRLGNFVRLSQKANNWEGDEEKKYKIAALNDEIVYLEGFDKEEELENILPAPITIADFENILPGPITIADFEVLQKNGGVKSLHEFQNLYFIIFGISL